MLPDAYRLRRSDTIATVVRTGRHITTAYVRLHALTQSTHPNSRVACVVGRKVHSSAVKRHHYQRWLREYAAELIKQLPQSYDLVLVARFAINTVETLSELKNSLKHISDELRRN